MKKRIASFQKKFDGLEFEDEDDDDDVGEDDVEVVGVVPIE